MKSAEGSSESTSAEYVPLKSTTKLFLGFQITIVGSLKI